MKRTHLGLLVFLLTQTLVAEEMKPLPGTNLARGKPASFSLAPNYRLTAGGDQTDLTDGIYVNAGQTIFWSRPVTVGWKFYRHPGLLIRLDLEQVAAIDAVSFDTVTGAAQVTFPAAVFLYVSDDGKTWHYATDLINEAVAQDRYTRHRFVARGLKTRGRYVAAYVVKGGFFCFVDEMEVLRGDHDPSSVTFGPHPVETERLEGDALDRSRRALQKNISLYFVEAARKEVNSVAKPVADTSVVRGELDRLQAEAAGQPEFEEVNYAGGPPYTGLDRQVCVAMGTYYEGLRGKLAEVWAPTGSMWLHTTNPFARTETPQVPDLHADMMIGEYEPVAINVSNNTSARMQVRVRLSELKGERTGAIWSSKAVQRRVTMHVIGSGFLFFDDVLTPIEGGTFEIPPGMTRQVWLILHSRGIVPDRYSGAVAITAGEQEFALPISATVYPIAMPENPEYLAQSWGYFTWKPAKGFELQAAAEMQRSYANVQVLHHAYIPWPKVDPQTKKLVRPIQLDFTTLDEMLAYRPYVRQWLLWPGLEFGHMKLNYHGATDIPAVGTPEHDALFREWVRQIRDHMQENSIPTDRWAFYWVDEPGDAAFLKRIVPASRLAKSVDPSILVWEDHRISLEILEQHPDAIDIHCCPLDFYRRHPEILKHVLAEKHPSSHYRASGSKGGDPHRYYRLHHMAAVELGLGGAGLWVWGDEGGHFNDYLGAYPSYGMVYPTPNGPITGKRREAWREGIEDVELWRHLRRLAETSGKEELKRLAAESPSRLLDSPSNTPEELMNTRLRILQTLAEAEDPK